MVSQSTRQRIRAARPAGCWLLLLAVLCGPLGAQASLAAGALKNCGKACPCDEHEHSERAVAGAPGAEDGDHGDAAGDAGCDDGCPAPCPDSCPDCACCPGLLAGLISTVPALMPGSVDVTIARVAPAEPAQGLLRGVFRPPSA